LIGYQARGVLRYMVIRVECQLSVENSSSTLKLVNLVDKVGCVKIENFRLSRSVGGR
jgi:hypothetical protein